MSSLTVLTINSDFSVFFVTLANNVHLNTNYYYCIKVHSLS